MAPLLTLIAVDLLLAASLTVSGTLIETIRLVGGGKADRGRVEVRMGGEWGTVCDDGWDHQDARVVCRMLSQSGGVAYSGAYYGSGTGRILLDSVQCQGDEDNLNMCTVGVPDLRSPASCGHHEDAGVQCGEDPPPDIAFSVTAVPVLPLSANCAQARSGLNVRLVGSGQLPASGLVQVRNPTSGINDFGFVCDDNWNILNARVVCRELCFNPDEALPGWRRPITMQLPTKPKIVLDDVRCEGTESTLVDCKHQPWNFHDCSPSELAAVTCSTVVASPQVPRAEVDCQNDRMVVTFRRNRNPALQTDSIVRGDNTPGTCKPRVWEDSVSVKVSLLYQQCATLLDQPGVSGNLTFESSLLVPLSAGKVTSDSEMPRVTQYRVKVQCQVTGTYSASRRLPGVGQPVLPASGQTKLQVSMLMYKDDTFTQPVAGKGMVLTPGGWINLGLTLDTQQQIKLVVTSCYVGPDLSDVTKPKQALLLDKCIQEDTVSTYTINDTFWGIRFQPFSFNNFTDVTIDCQAYACKNDFASGACDQSCNAAANKHYTTTRKKRQRRHHITSTYRLMAKANNSFINAWFSDGFQPKPRTSADEILRLFHPHITLTPSQSHGSHATRETQMTGKENQSKSTL